MSKAKNEVARPQFYEETKTANAWILFVPPETFSVAIPFEDAPIACRTNDAIVFANRDRAEILGVRRICLFHDEIAPDGKRLMRYYFDRALDFETPVPLETAREPRFITDAVERVGEEELDAVLRARNAPEFRDLPRFDDPRRDKKILDEAKCRAHVRDLLCRIVEFNLLGPAGGEKETIVDQRVRDRYLLGRLAPHDSSLDPEAAPEQVEENDGMDPYANDLFDVQEQEEHVADDARKFARGYDEERDDEEDTVGAAQRASLTPSSIGMTFCVGKDVSELEIAASWGAYDRVPREGWRSSAEDGPSLCWKRSPRGGKIRLAIPKFGGALEERSVDENYPGIVVNGRVTKQLAGDLRLVSVFLLNRQEPLKTKKDKNWIFQAKLTARGLGAEPIFQSRSLARSRNGARSLDPEEDELDMIYRDHYEFAVGHNVSVHAVPSSKKPGCAVEISTTFLPNCELPTTESRTPGAFDMRWLADADEDQLFAQLDAFALDYLAWIEEQELKIDDPASRLRDDDHDFRKTAKKVVGRLREAQNRFAEGIATLRENPDALLAFRFMNDVMADQRVHTLYAAARAKEFSDDKRSRERRRKVRPEDYDKPEFHQWRPFQLAFILLSLSSLVNPRHPDRSQVHGAAELLWFPTGGGKTEAYLGLAAFAMAIRRRQGALGGLDADRGLTVVMRYTLRLLTLQQFQRAATLICAMEVKRRKEPKIWKETPFTLGLWVGQKTTPNKTAQCEEAISEAKRIGRSYRATPTQLPRCPWCGGEIQPGRDVTVDLDRSRTVLNCGCSDGRCDFTKEKNGLPVVVVDEELYRRPPSMLIATVDKFAKLAWENAARNLFGKVDRECERHGLCWPGCECNQSHSANRGKGLAPAKIKRVKAIRPPDLIIQDEFHLISGPLGTIVGLYESAIDELCSWELDGVKIRPKIVASTATTRRANEQGGRVFEREVKIFPPNGLDVADNYFSRQKTGEDCYGRRYIGICSPGTTQQASAVRVYAHLVTGARFLFERFGKLADPYMTLVGYFSSLRELGGARRLVEDNVRTLARKVQKTHDPYPGIAPRYLYSLEELTSRVASAEVPEKLEALGIEFNPELALHVPQDAVDVVLATNMFSVGVDVQRLGLMIVNNQPKNSAEYIQATSRVGRQYPGLVFTLFTWSRPRDFSHYETFEQFHSTFYKFVEAQSVTPFAPRALDRGLTGVMIGLLRAAEPQLSANEDAERMRDHDVRKRAEELLEPIGARAERVAGKERGDYARSLVSRRLDDWEKTANDPNSRLGYERTLRSGDLKGLVHRPGVKPWDARTVGLSMREVEPELGLILDKSDDHEERSWAMNPKNSDKSNKIDDAQGDDENG